MRMDEDGCFAARGRIWRQSERGGNGGWFEIGFRGHYRDFKGRRFKGLISIVINKRRLGNNT